MVSLWWYVQARSGVAYWPESNAIGAILFGTLFMFAWFVSKDVRPDAKPILRVTNRRLWIARIVQVTAWAFAATQIVVSLLAISAQADQAAIVERASTAIFGAGIFAMAVHSAVGYGFTTQLLGAWRETVVDADDE